MKKTLLGITIFIVFGILVLLLTNSYSGKLTVVADTTASTVTKKLEGKPLTFSIIQTGKAVTQEAFIYQGGSFLKQRTVSHVAVWVKHAKGNFLFDTGLGDKIDEQHAEMSLFHATAFAYEKEKSVKEQLIQQGISPDTIKTIVLSHLHWDHASGIKDFPSANIVTTNEEYSFATTEDAHSPAFLKSQYNGSAIRWDFLNFEKKPYKCFDEYVDYFGDGSVVFVKLVGHTKGSLGMFLTTSEGKQFFFTGDTTWSLEGFLNPSPKHFFPSMYVDLEKERLNETIISIHHLMKKDTALIVVPAHDFQAQKQLAHFPVFQ